MLFTLIIWQSHIVSQRYLLCQGLMARQLLSPHKTIWPCPEIRDMSTLRFGVANAEINPAQNNGECEDYMTDKTPIMPEGFFGEYVKHKSTFPLFGDIVCRYKDTGTFYDGKKLNRISQRHSEVTVCQRVRSSWRS